MGVVVTTAVRAEREALRDSVREERGLPQPSTWAIKLMLSELVSTVEIT